MNGLADRVVLVTGGASGIGAGIAQVFASLGSTVVVGDLQETRATELAAELVAGPAGACRSIGVRLDVTDRPSVAAAVARVEGAVGAVDVLVNNAGISDARPFMDIDDATYGRVIDVNLRGVFVATQAVLPGMLERGFGRIVNISSMAGKEGLPGLTHYCASKFAVIGVTQALAKEVATKGVTVNAVCPGVVMTPLWDDPRTGILNQMGEGAWEGFIAGIPQGRPQTAEDMGHACAYLASDLARNITGEAINVSGGQQMH